MVEDAFSGEVLTSLRLRKIGPVGAARKAAKPMQAFKTLLMVQLRSHPKGLTRILLSLPPVAIRPDGWTSIERTGWRLCQAIMGVSTFIRMKGPAGTPTCNLSVVWSQTKKSESPAGE